MEKTRSLVLTLKKDLFERKIIEPKLEKSKGGQEGMPGYHILTGSGDL
jgi:hypothetical protein